MSVTPPSPASRLADWQPSASIQCLQLRARFLDAIRQFFRDRSVMEVDTPMLCKSTATDPHLASIAALYHAVPGAMAERRYLQTSPEFAMKRLLAAGSGPIYQLGRAFRDGERGRRHNPEFTMLEWYRPGFELEALMAEVADLVLATAGIKVSEFLSYRQAFIQVAEIDPFLVSDEALLERAAEIAGWDTAELSRDDCLDLILSHQIEPGLGQQGGTFLYNYPPSQAALARTCEEDGVLVARRFELYIHGVEIANGYDELTDAVEQGRRFAADNRSRAAKGLPEIPIDTHFLAALHAGMPNCAGVALGVDRLLMVATGASAIDEVIPFPIDRI